MAFQHTIRHGQQRLRCGYTTGVCAALAASGAARLLLTGTCPKTLSISTPKGPVVEVEPAFCRFQDGGALCGVRKDAGDDPDVTHGAVIAAEVRRTAAGITIDGGEGVGRVTKPGLDQPVGAAAINRVPRAMIAAAVEEVCAAAGYAGGISVVISVPEGETLARRTFNPRLGIVGGISILGTSGLVEPMSEQALVDTIEVEIRQAKASGAEKLILTPGNYGLDFVRSHYLRRARLPVVRISNYIGDALDCAVSEGFSAVLLVGHVGKLVKLAGGVMNTHSRMADCRRELFCAHAAICGADAHLCRELLEAATADACIALLDAAPPAPGDGPLSGPPSPLRQRVMESLLSAIQAHLDLRSGGMTAGAVLFSNEYGFLGQTPGASAFREEMAL